MSEGSGDGRGGLVAKVRAAPQAVSPFTCSYQRFLCVRGTQGWIGACLSVCLSVCPRRAHGLEEAGKHTASGMLMTSLNMCCEDTGQTRRGDGECEISSILTRACLC